MLFKRVSKYPHALILSPVIIVSGILVPVLMLQTLHYYSLHTKFWSSYPQKRLLQYGKNIRLNFDALGLSPVSFVYQINIRQQIDIKRPSSATRSSADIETVINVLSIMPASSLNCVIPFKNDCMHSLL